MFKQKSKTPTFIKRAILLGLPVVLLVFSYSLATSKNRVEAATSGTINFQARLLTAAGNVVPDGYYNVEFKIYKQLTPDSGETPVQGSCTTNPGAVADEDCAWTETRTGSDKVRVANGYLTVNLGSVTAFSGTINWDQEMWLTMNIGGTGSPSWDGEMTPRLKLTAVPYAFRAGKLVSADGTGSATVANNDTGTICIQSSVNCGFVKNTSASLQTADTTIKIQGNLAATTSLTVRGAASQTADLLALQSWNGTSATDVVNFSKDGALTLQGPGTVGFVTPAGDTVATKIRIPLYDPGAYGQILMFGLPSGANSNARALTVVDARTVSHQPSIAVLSPNESEIAGFSWEGQNTTAYIKTSSSGITLQANSTDILSLAKVSNNAVVKVGNATGAKLGIGKNATYAVDVAGDINLDTGGAYRINGTAICTASGCTINTATVIQNQNVNAQTSASFWIDGTGKAAALQAASLDTVTAAGTLTVGGTNAGSISLAQNTTVAAGKGLTITGGNTASRPASPTEGTLYFDSSTKQMLVYANGKWQSAVGSSSTKIVGMGAATSCTGTTPVASSNYDAADYIVTSCTSAQTMINSAITALGSTGGTVYIMEGTYIIDGTINLASNIKIAGAGQSTVLKFKNSSTTTLNMFTASSLSRISMENLRLDGNKANNGSAVAHVGISLTTIGSGTGASAVPGATIKSVNIENFQGTGIYLATVANTTISDSYFGQNVSYAIDTNTAGSMVAIADSSFHNNAIENVGSTSWNITGNTFDATSNGSYLLDLSNVGNSYHTVTGNTFAGTNGINITGSQNVVSGNTIVTTNNVGINVTGGANTISGNKVHDTSGSTANRISISGSSNTITGNDLTASGGTGYAISITSTGAVGNTLSNNRFGGTGSNTINDLGKETIYNGQATGSNDIIIKGSAGLGLNTTTATASLTLQGAIKSQALPSPSAPTIQKIGATGAATYTYAISASDGLGETLISSTASATSAASPLTASNYNRLTWTRVGGAMSYKIYRTAVTSGSPATTGLIGTVSASATTMQFDDTGLAASGSAPASNSTGGAYFAGSVDTGGAYLINGVSINTAGTLSNVAYLNQANTFKAVTNSASAFAVQNASGGTVIGVDTTDTNLISNSDFETNTTGWIASGTGSSIALNTTTALYGSNSLTWSTSTTANAAARFALNPVVTTITTYYTASAYIKQTAGTPTSADLSFRFSPNGTATADCNISDMTYYQAITGSWRRISCTFNSGTTPTISGYLQLMNYNATANTYVIDGVQLEAGTVATSYGLGAIRLNAVVTSPVTVRVSEDTDRAFNVTNTNGDELLTVNAAQNQVNIGHVQAGALATAKLTFGDTECGNTSGACVWMGEGSADDVLQLHGYSGLALSTGDSELQRVRLESNGTFNISDNFASQTKGYRFRTNGSGLDIQSTGVGVAGEMWFSGYTTADYSGTQVPFFRMVASSAAVYVGDFQTTSTPTLIVLSSKTTAAADPVGYSGAMYYNAFVNKMRCYQNSDWADCMGIPKPNTRRTTNFTANGLATASPGGTNAGSTWFNGYGDSLSMTSSATNTLVAATSSTPMMQQPWGGTAINNFGGLFGTAIYHSSAEPVMQTYAAPGTTASTRVWIGMTSQTGTSAISVPAASDTPAGSIAAFRYSTSAPDTTYRCVTSSGSASTYTATGVTAAAGHKFEIAVFSGKVVFKIDNQVVCTHTTNLPAAALLSPVISATTLVAGTAPKIGIAWLYLESDQ